ncbi:uncharacterized protein METZ01_LOCUS296338, partial [marine metagenome]
CWYNDRVQFCRFSSAHHKNLRGCYFVL